MRVSRQQVTLRDACHAVPGLTYRQAHYLVGSGALGIELPGSGGATSRRPWLEPDDVLVLSACGELNALGVVQAVGLSTLGRVGLAVREWLDTDPDLDLLWQIWVGPEQAAIAPRVMGRTGLVADWHPAEVLRRIGLVVEDELIAV